MEPIRFLCDENVRSDVVRVFERHGHAVILARDVMAAGSPDDLVVLYGSYERLIVVTHDRDFRKFRKLLPEHERARFLKAAGRLQLEVKYEQSPVRVEEEMINIEHFFRQAQARGKPFIMSIQDVGIKITTK